MKKQGLTIGLVCFACISSYFSTSQEAVASNVMPDARTIKAQVHSESKKITLEGLIQKLETTTPLSVEKVSETLGVKLALTDRSHPVNASYITNRIDYGEGLIIDRAELLIRKEKNEAVGLILKISKDAGCFTRNRIEKTYPDMRYVLPGSLPVLLDGHVLHAKRSYQATRSWGNLFFDFKVEPPECLTDIYLTVPEPELEPVVSDEHKMKLEEILQKMEAANPWSTEKVSKALGAKFTYSHDQDYKYYEDNRVPLYYEENLLLRRIRLRIDAKTNKTDWLILSVSDNGGCFTLDRIKKTYPDIKHSPTDDPSNRTDYHYIERTWGRLSFGFYPGKRPDCLSSVVLTPKQ